MSAQSDLDRQLASWLAEEAPGRAPDHLRANLGQRLDRTAQVGFPVVLPGRLPVLRPWQLAAAAILVAAIGAGIWSSGSWSPGIGGRPTPTPSASPSQSPSPSASPTPSPAPSLIGAPALLRGVNAARAFDPHFTYVVPAGWQGYWDRTGLWAIQPPDAGHVSGRPTTPQGAIVVAPDDFFSGGTVWDDIAGYRDPVPISADGKTQVGGVAATAAALAHWLETRPELVATTPTATTVMGLAGYQLDIRLSPKAPSLCGGPCADLFRHGESSGTWTFGIAGPERARVYLLDEPKGVPLLLVIDDVDGVNTAGLLAESTPVIESMRLVTGP